MTQKYGDKKILSPGTVIISAAGEVNDVRKTVSPVMSNKDESQFLYIDFSSDSLKLGGSAFAQSLNAIGNEAPTVRSSEYFVNTFNAIQALVSKSLLLAAHDVSAGGLITTLLEMTFSNTQGGINVNVDSFNENDIIKILFSENPALVIQVDNNNTKQVVEILSAAGVKYHNIGNPCSERTITVNHAGHEYTFAIDKLRDVWYKSSYLLDRKQSNNGCAEQRFENYKNQPVEYSFPNTFTGKAADLGITGFRHAPSGIKAAIIREKGVNGGTGTDGAPFTFAVDEDCMSGYADRNSWNAKNNCGTGETYQGIYNFYNIGAYGTYMSPAIRGLIWAKGGFDSSVTSYNRPWNTKEKGILGGAESIANNYISVNQHTLYLQKFNVSPDALNSTYTHQYVANIRAHAQEALSIYQGYQENGLVGKTFEFLIPVYQNMPGENDSIEEEEKPETPPVEVEAPNISEAIVSSGFKLNNYYIHNIGTGVSISTFESQLKNIYSDMQVVGFQNKNGQSKSGNIGTGDTIVISNGKTQDAYTAIVYGDNSGDGQITILDLLRTQKYLLGYSNLTDHEMIASDVNQDGLITILDLLRIQKAILGYIDIGQ